MANHKETPEQDLETRAELFKALGHPVRLLILNLIHAAPRHVEELSTILRLSPAALNLDRWCETVAGLSRSQKDQYYQTYSLAGDLPERTLRELILMPQPRLAVRVEEDAYREKVLATFLRQGRLVSIPAQLKKRQIVLEKLVEEFEPGRTYTEREVNQVLVDYHDDVATLRRGLIEHQLMQRDSGRYWRLGTEGSGPAEPAGRGE